MRIQPDQLIAALNWRYATKIFDATAKISAPLWSALEKSLVLTPTSYGLQPYKFVVVQDPAVRATLLSHSYGQKQVVDASHFVVLLGRTDMKPADVEKLLLHTSNVRNIPLDKLKGYGSVILKHIVHGLSAEQAHEWAARQIYIALGNLMTCAAVLGVDACPMEGIVPAEYDKVLKLEGTGHKTVVACALGYRAAEDKYATMPKVRYDANELVQYV